MQFRRILEHTSVKPGQMRCTLSAFRTPFTVWVQLLCLFVGTTQPVLRIHAAPDPPVDTTDIEAVRQAINTQWKARNYSGIKAIIAERLSRNPNDVLGLGLEQVFCVFADRDIAKAHASAEALQRVVTSSADPKAKAIADWLTGMIEKIDPTEGNLTPQMRDALHRNLREFPFSAQIFELQRLTAP